MSGVLGTLVALSNSESMVVTVGVGLGVGYQSAATGDPVGSISDDTYRGKTINMVRSTSGVDFQVLIDDVTTLSQSFFTRLTIEDGTGVLRSYTSASATFIGGGVGGDSWFWGNGSNRVFAAADSGEQHRLTFFF